MSGFPYQSVSGDGSLPMPQEMEPMNRWIDEYSFDEDFLQSITFSATYSGNGHANMQSSEQITPMSVNYSRNISTDMQPAGQFTEAFVDQSLNIPTHLLPAGQPNLISINQSRNTPTNIQDIGQFATSASHQSPNVQTNIYPLGQHTQAPINYGGNTNTNVPHDGQATQPTIHYGDNSTTNVPPKEQAAGDQFDHSGSQRTNIPLIGQATPALVHHSGNQNTNTQATGTSSPASTQRKGKHPAVVEDKRIERCAREYNFSYDEIRILLDYANARLKGIETNEPKDAPSRYIISRFEQVRRAYPDHATWPYDIPEGNIIKLLPSQKRQNRAPLKSYHSASEKQRQELDARYHESRQWHDPPPPKPDQTHQDTLTAPAIDNVETGLNPSPSWNFNFAEAAETSTMTQHDSMNSLDKSTPPAASDDIHMGGFQESAQIPAPLPIFTPTEQGIVNPLDKSDPPAMLDDSQHDYLFEEPYQLSPPLPSFTPTDQNSVDPLENSNLPTASDDGQYDSLFKEPIQLIDDSELDEYFKEPDRLLSRLPTFTPSEKDNINPLDNSNLPAASDDSQYDSLFKEPIQLIDDSELDEYFKEPDRLPSRLPTFTPSEKDNINPLDNSNLPAASDDSQYDSLFKEPIQLIDDSELDEYFKEPDRLPSQLPTFTPSEKDNINPLDNSNLPAASDNSQYDYLFKEPTQLIDDSELDEYFEKPAQPPPKRRSKARFSRRKAPPRLNISPMSSTNIDRARSTMLGFSSLLPTLTPPEHEIHWPFRQDQSKEELPFTFPYLDYWPTFAPIICHPLVRALELHTGRKDPGGYREYKGYTIPVGHYRDSVKKTPAPAGGKSTPETRFMPRRYKMTEELRKEIEQRVGIYMKLRWGSDDDDDGEKATSGELVREDLRRLEMENPTWRYKMAFLVDKWGLGGLQGSELSGDYFHRMELIRQSYGVDPLVEED